MPAPAFTAITPAQKRFLCAPRWLWIAFAVTSVIFVAFPAIDTSVSRHFFTPGVGFEARGTWLEQLTDASVGFLLVWGNLILIALVSFPRLAKRLKIRLSAKQLLFLLLVLVLGPGLIVNAVLKEHWGRARPVKTEQFGGTNKYTPAFIPSDQQGRSFSSGHAAASTYWIIVVLLLAPGRTWLLRVAVLYSLAVSWMRVAAGAHFLSDIVTSYFIMAILTLALHEMMFARDSSAARILAQWASELRQVVLHYDTRSSRFARLYGIPPLLRRLQQDAASKRRPRLSSK